MVLSVCCQSIVSLLSVCCQCVVRNLFGKGPTDRQVVPQAQERGRTRSRSRSRRRGRSSSRPAKRRNYQPERDYGFDRQPQQNFNPPRGQAAGGNSYSGQAARPKTHDRPNQNQGYRNDRDNLDPRFFTPELIQKIAEAYDGLHK